MEKVINISWSSQVKLITVGTLIFLAILFYYLISNGYLRASVLTPAVLILIIGVLAYFAMQAPMSIKLTESKIIINKLLGSIEIAYTDIKTMGEYSFDQGDIRIMGSGGFFGYTGSFKNKTFGNYSAYVGNTQQAFFIQTKKGKYFVISCDKREEVLEHNKRNVN